MSLRHRKRTDAATVLGFTFRTGVPRSPGCPHHEDLKAVLGASFLEKDGAVCSKFAFYFLDVRPQPGRKTSIPASICVFMPVVFYPL